MRRSIYAYASTPINRTVIETAIRDAVQAPNHHRTQPWRFFVFSGDARARLARAYESAAQRVGRDIPKAVQRAYDAPVMVVLACMPDTANPRVKLAEEQFAVAAAAQTLMLSFAALGVGTLLTTGELAESPEVHDLVGLDSGKGQVMGVINVGYRDPERPVRAREEPAVAAFTKWFDSE